jgi:hypothetical protein
MLRKIRDFGPPWRDVERLPCRHPEHEFPSMIVLEPGVWEHECPGCGERVTVTVPLVTCRTETVTIAPPENGTDGLITYTTR